jgi:hypothetical protein
MTDGHGRQHALFEMDGHVDHASTTARWTKTAFLAGKRDELRVPAFPADQVKTAVLESSTTKVLLEFAHPEFRQAAEFFGALAKLRPVRLDASVQDGRSRLRSAADLE